MTDVGRVAIVTGGGTGIGAATARHLATAEYAVAVVGRRNGELERTVDEIRAAGGVATAVAADLADPSAPAAVVDAVVSLWGRVDVLVNSAATIRTGPLEEMTQELFDRHVAVNVRAPYFLVQAALPYLRRSDAASVINISSSSGSLCIPGQSLYGMTKAALEYHTRSLAAELAQDGIRVNCVAPGPVDTPIHLTWAGDDVAGAYRRMSAELPIARMGTADELGYWIASLARPEASWITGNVWHVDGGQVLPGAKSKISAE
jgi:meso-butanediol dehydrogenase / (S,S)-butanediol dehydrogenase / diacetyl reductase